MKTNLKSNFSTTESGCAILIILLNVFDAFATLRHVGHGAEEANPFMAVFIYSPITFVSIKHIVVTGCLLLLFVFTQSYLKYILISITAIFALLSVYQCFGFWII